MKNLAGKVVFMKARQTGKTISYAIAALFRLYQQGEITLEEFKEKMAELMKLK